MPDISELNGTAIDNVAEFDGLTVTEFTGLLDTYTGAAAGYSVRRLSSTYTGDIMRVRRDSDNVEADIGFDSNNEFGLTSPVSNPSSGGPFTDFADFIGHGTGSAANGFCRWWYDQSGNAVDAGQATSTSQPKIYDSSTGIVEEGAAGKEKPALDFDGTDDNLDVGSSISIGTSDYQHFGVYKIDNTDLGLFSGVVRDNTAQNNHLIYTNISDGYMRTGLDGSFYSPTTSTSINPIAQSLLAIQYDRDANASFFIDATAAGTADISAKSASSLSMQPRIGGAGAQETLNGTIQEFILWSNIANRTGIETNINGYFQIF